MIDVHFKVNDFPQLLGLFGYFQTYAIAAHRHIAEIRILWAGVRGDIFAFEVEARKRLGRSASKGAPYLQIVMGSTHGADLTRQEQDDLFKRIMHRLGIDLLLLAAHIAIDGRIDLHLIVVNRDEAGRPLLTSKFRAKMRAIAHDVTFELNLRRLAIGRHTIGALWHGSVYFLRLEDLAQSFVPEPSVAKPELVALKFPEAPDGAAAEPRAEGNLDPLSASAATVGLPAPAPLPADLVPNHGRRPLPPRSGDSGDAGPIRSGPKESTVAAEPVVSIPVPSALPFFAPHLGPYSPEESETEREKKKRKKKEEEESALAELRRALSISELLDWIWSAPAEHELPPRNWLDYAVKSGIYTPDPSVRETPLLFLGSIFMPVAAHFKDSELSAERKADLMQCNDLAEPWVTAWRRQREPEEISHLEESRDNFGPTM